MEEDIENFSTPERKQYYGVVCIKVTLGREGVIFLSSGKMLMTLLRDMQVYNNFGKTMDELKRSKQRVETRRLYFQLGASENDTNLNQLLNHVKLVLEIYLLRV